MPENNDNWGNMIPLVGGLVGQGLGLLLEGHEDKRQYEQQKKLTELQVKANKDLGQYNLGLQKEMWNYTGYKNQVKQLKQAGLNPGLLYGKGGGGGQTANIAQGNATGGTAAQQSGEIASMTGLALQMQSQIELQKAQAEALKATANKDNAQAAKISGVDTTETLQNIEQIKANITNTNAKTALTNIETGIKSIEKTIQEVSQWDQIKQIDLIAQKIQHEVHIIENNSEISEETKDTAITNAKIELINKIIEGNLKKAQINVANQNVQTQITQLAQKWHELGIEERRNLTLQIMNISAAKYMDKQRALATWKTINESVKTVTDAVGEFHNPAKTIIKK